MIYTFQPLLQLEFRLLFPIALPPPGGSGEGEEGNNEGEEDNRILGAITQATQVSNILLLLEKLCMR